MIFLQSKYKVLLSIFIFTILTIGIQPIKSTVLQSDDEINFDFTNPIFANPSGIDNNGTHFFVSNDPNDDTTLGQDYIQVLSPLGLSLDEVDKWFTNDTQNIRDIAVTKDFVYYMDGSPTNTKIYRANHDGTNQVEFLSLTNGNGNGIDVDDEFIYAADHLNNKVYKFSISNKTEVTSGNWPLNLNYATSLYVDGLDIYISSYDSNIISKFDTATGSLNFSTTAISGHTAPYGVTVYEDKLYSTFYTSKSAVAFDKMTGKAISQVSNLGSGLIWGAQINDSKIYYTDKISDSFGYMELSQFNLIPFIDNLNYPYSIDNNGTHIFVIEDTDQSFTAGNEAITIFDAKGVEVDTFLSPDTLQIRDLVVTDNYIYFIDIHGTNSKIYRVDHDGQNMITWLDVQGSENGLAQIDTDGTYLYVLNNRGVGDKVVHKFKISDKSEVTNNWPLVLNAEGRGLSVDGNNMYLTYGNNENIYKIDMTTANVLLNITSAGNINPSFISYDDDSIYVSYTGLIMKFSKSTGVEEAYYNSTFFIAFDLSINGSEILIANFDGAVKNIIKISINDMTPIITPDIIAPIVEITSPSNSLYGKLGFVLSYTVSDGIVKVYIDDVVNSTNINSGTEFMDLSSGNHNITITSEDTAGNIGKDQILFTVDSDAPIVIITSPTAISYDNSSVELTYTVSNDVVNVKVYLNNVANTTNMNSGFILSELTNGTYNITIMIEDKIGNVGNSEVIFTIEILVPATSDTNTTSQSSTTPTDTNNTSTDNELFGLSTPIITFGSIAVLGGGGIFWFLLKRKKSGN